MIDENFMDIIYRVDGGKLSAELFQRVKEKHDMSFEEELQPFIDYAQETMSRNEYGDMITYLETNYTIYIDESYKIGFNDGIRFLVSILSDGK